MFVICQIRAYPLINVTSPLQVYLPSASADGLVKALYLWTLVPLLTGLNLREMWLKPRKRQPIKTVS